jgi:hypothetical protein
VHHLGGAYGRIPEQATPFPNRAAQYWINIYGFWTDPADDEDRVRFVRGLSADLDPFATGGQYVNFQGHEQAGHRALDPKAIFGPDKYARLVEAKRRYDPDNVFHINHNTPRDSRRATTTRVADSPRLAAALHPRLRRPDAARPSSTLPRLRRVSRYL